MMGCQDPSNSYKVLVLSDPLGYWSLSLPIYSGWNESVNGLIKERRKVSMALPSHQANSPQYTSQP